MHMCATLFFIKTTRIFQNNNTVCCYHALLRHHEKYFNNLPVIKLYQHVVCYQQTQERN